MLALLFAGVSLLITPVATQTPGYDWNGFTATTLGCGTDSGALNVGLSQTLVPGATGLKVKQIAFAIYGTMAMPAYIQLDGNPSSARLSTSGIQSCCAPNCDLAVQVAAAGQTWYNSPCGVNSCGGSSSQNHWYYMDFSSTSVGTIEQTGISQATFYDGSSNQIGADMVNIASRGSAFFVSYTEIIPTATPTPSVTKSPVSPSLTPSTTASASIDPSVTVSSTVSRSVSLSQSLTMSGSKSVSTQASVSHTPSISASQSRQASNSVSPSRQASNSVSPSVQASASVTTSRTQSHTPSPTSSPTPNLNFDVITIAGMGNVVQMDGIGTAASVPFPQYMTFTQDYTGVYISEASNADQIRLLNLTTNVVISIAGMWNIQDTGTGIGTNAAMNSPAGLALDGPNNILYAVERDANLVRGINLASLQLQYIVGDPESGPGCADGIGTNALFTHPEGMTIDQPNQFLYVADTGCNAIRAVNISSQTATTVAGQLGVTGWQESYGVGQPGKFWSPTGIRYNNMNLYVTDTHWNNIRIIYLASPGLISHSQNILGGNGPPNTSIDGTGTGVTFNNPMDLEYDPINNVLFVSQVGTNQNIIRKITLNTIWDASVITLIGNSITQSIDGVGTQVSFNNPIGIGYNPTPNYLYVADSVGNKIRQIALTIPLPTQSVSASISTTASLSLSVSATTSSSDTASSSASMSSGVTSSISISSSLSTTLTATASSSASVSAVASVSSSASDTASSSVSASTVDSSTVSASTSVSPSTPPSSTTSRSPTST